MDGKDIAKITAISKNLEKKKKGRGNPALLINSFAESLANREVSLNAVDESDLFEIIDRIYSGEPKQDDSIIRAVGAIGKHRKDGTYGWYKNMLIIFKAGLFIDYRNNRLFDFPEGLVMDFQKKKMMKMTDDDIEEFIKVFRGAKDGEKETDNN